MCKCRLIACVVFALALQAVPICAQAQGSSSRGEHHTAGSADPNPLTIDPDLAIFTAVLFFVLHVFLSKFAWRPMLAGFDKRERALADRIEEANRSTEKANQALEQYEAKLAATKDEVKARLAEARKLADGDKEMIVAEAKSAAKSERERAVEEIRIAKQAAVRELDKRSADTAVLLAERILGRNVDRQDHGEIV